MSLRAGVVVHIATRTSAKIFQVAAIGLTCQVASIPIYRILIPVMN